MSQNGLQNELESLTRLGKRLQQLEAGRFDEFRGSDHLGPPFSSSQDSSSSRVSPVTSGSSSAASRLLMASATLEELVDFGPVYRCLHVHSVLNEQADFERHYCSQRRKQCQLSLSLSPAQLAGLANYSEFFGGLVGFFLVDEHLRHTLPGKLGAYQAYLDELWANTVQRMLRFAQVNSAACSRPSGLVRLKEFVVLFVRTMQSLGFPTAGLEEMIELVQKRYETVLASQWRDR
ncbi:unnamed protein product [Protopolystoma xenopodis]|uniref:Exocyst complex component 6 n=1 Tax=Protopolystoma xenopodis TaxID=117903 RepID=A0A3S5BQS9_9PLAT|nr:unnamed protein product [Protopolystoma xenopodis]